MSGYVIAGYVTTFAMLGGYALYLVGLSRRGGSK